MGWLVNRKQDLWEKYAVSSPQNIPLTDEEIIEEVRAVRYAKTHNQTKIVTYNEFIAKSEY